MKWYIKLLIALLVIVFSPIIVIFLIVAAVTYLIRLPGNVKAYENSQYYKEFGLPFTTSRLHSPEHRFFNSFKKRNLQVSYIRQESNGLEYFIYNDTLFLFPDFDQIDYDEEKAEWQVNYDGDWKNFEQAYRDTVSEIDTEAPALPIKLLVERSMFPLLDLNGVSVPECISLTQNYETAFENEDSPLKLRVPANTQELYDMMLATPELCGDFEIAENGNIHWDLYKDIRIHIDVDVAECCFGLVKRSSGKTESGFAHWHPTIFEIYDEVCKVGTKGNVLVIRAFMGGASVLYMGDEEGCPYSPDKKTLFGKIYYLQVI